MEFETHVGKSRFKNWKKLLKHIKTSLGFVLDINPEITFGLVPITQTAIYIYIYIYIIYIYIYMYI